MNLAGLPILGEERVMPHTVSDNSGHREKLLTMATNSTEVIQRKTGRYLDKVDEPGRVQRYQQNNDISQIPKFPNLKLLDLKY